MKNNKTILLLTFCFQFITLGKAKAQKVIEFEGVITDSHQVEAIKKDYDISRDFGYIGKQSDFYYKSGNYKWFI